MMKRLRSKSAYQARVNKLAAAKLEKCLDYMHLSTVHSLSEVDFKDFLEFSKFLAK